MEPSIRKAYEASRHMQGKPFKSACYSPYTSLYFCTNGDVVACCKSSNYVLGNVATESLEQIWHGKRAQAMRRSLRDYNFKLGCEFCEWQLKGGQYDQVYATTFDHLPVSSADPEWPAMMEFTISNTCNLACIMCYGELSSTIRANRERLPPIPKVYDDRFFADLRQFLPHLKIAKFFGGEPFLAQESYRIWDMMIEDGIDIPCHVTTNGTQWGPRVERILDAFRVPLSISIDGMTKATVESIRVNADFDKVIENTRRFRDYSRRKQTYMSLTYCLMRQNWHEFGDYLGFAEDLDLDVFINTVITPANCSLYTLPPGELLQIADRMQAMDHGGRYSGLRRNGKLWTSAVNALRNNANERQVAGVGELVKSNARLRAAMHRDHLAEANELAAAGRLEQALEAVRRVPANDVTTFQAALTEAHICRRLGRFDATESAIERALQMWQRSPLPWLERAWLRQAQGRREEAIADAEEARRRVGGDDIEVRWWVEHALATLHYETGRKVEALAAVQQVTEREPERYDAFMMQAWMLRDLGRLQECEDVIARAMALRPADAKPWIERAWLRCVQGRPEQGIADVAEAQSRLATDSPLQADAHHALAVLCEQAGRRGEALQHMDALLALLPGRLDLLLQRASMRERHGDPTGALADADRALQANPHHPEAAAMVARLRGA